MQLDYKSVADTGPRHWPLDCIVQHTTGFDMSREQESAARLIDYSPEDCIVLFWFRIVVEHTRHVGSVKMYRCHIDRYGRKGWPGSSGEETGKDRSRMQLDHLEQMELCQAAGIDLSHPHIHLPV